MKNASAVFTLVLFLVLLVSGQAQPLIEKTFSMPEKTEAILTLKAAAPGANWAKKDAEAATLTVEVDGEYNQDVILFGGAQPFDYRIVLGQLKAGTHTVRISLNAAQSAPNAKQAVISSASIAPHQTTDKWAALAIAHAPILYARPDTIGKFSDVPVMMWYEVIPGVDGTSIQYSVIFTNEDGGTQTAALMARWGRVTDIEWLCAVKFDADNKVISRDFQGTSHRNLSYDGKYEASHPLFVVASRNNNFSDQLPNPRPALRFAPVPVHFDTAKQSREVLMDQYPWTYRLMYDEMLREGKIVSDTEIVGAAGIGITMLDPRRYLYIDGASTQVNAALSFAVKLKGDPRWYASDLGNNYFRIDRSGWFRSTVRLPKIKGLNQIEQIIMRCDAMPDTQTRKQTFKPEPTCATQTINQVFLLNDQFAPAASLSLKTKETLLRFGDAIEIYRSKTSTAR